MTAREIEMAECLRWCLKQLPGALHSEDKAVQAWGLVYDIENELEALGTEIEDE